MSKDKIRPISGFPELLPEEQIVFNRFIEIVRRNYELSGFTPIETPAVERKTTLVSKGGNEKEIYALSRLAASPDEKTETEIALHFDLTVPLARYVAFHNRELTFPFKRYQIQKVWRGERAQAGRYREFYQCDIDVIGKDELPIMHDAEMPAIIYSIFEQFGLGDILIRVNNRKVLNGYFADLGLSPEEAQAAIRAVDKAEKVTQEELVSELTGNTPLDATKAEALLSFLTEKKGTDETIASLQKLDAGPLLTEGIAELVAVVEGIRQLGVPDRAFTVDLSIARGLDYYTGTVYETLLVEHPELGSVCSGGRFDDLASLFTNEKLPGVGISIGLTRLIVALMKKGVIQPGPKTTAQVLVTAMDPSLTDEYLAITKDLRAAGISTEVILKSGQSFKAQMRYANKKAFPLVVIMGKDEFENKTIQLKDMETSETTSIPREELVASVSSR